MKKYKFMIKKSKETEIELCAENHSEAMIKLLEKAFKRRGRSLVYESFLF